MKMNFPYSKNFRIGFPLTILLFPFTSFALEPTLIHQLHGAQSQEYLGYSVGVIGDLDGDGKAEFIVGTPYIGSAFVYSGENGSLIHHINGNPDLPRLGWSVDGLQDINRDGKPDFIVGAIGYTGSDTGYAFVFSGATGSLLFQVSNIQARFGGSVAGIEDINKDSIADFIVGGGGSAFVYSGATGDLLKQFDNPDGGSNDFGHVVADAGDVDADGTSDLIFGYWYADPLGTENAGSAYVFSGSTGNLLYRKDGVLPNDYFGWSVAGIGDINNDGKADFIIGAPNHIDQYGLVFVYSGATGQQLFAFLGPYRFGWFGEAVANAGDINGDGVNDILIGAGGASPKGIVQAGSVFIYSGTDGSLISQINGPPKFLLGSDVAGGGDINGDGKPDILVGASISGLGFSEASICGHWGAGSVFVYGYGFCSEYKADLNRDGFVAPADLVLLLNCVFLNCDACDFGSADVNRDGNLTPSDVVVELDHIFLNIPASCTP